MMTRRLGSRIGRCGGVWLALLGLPLVAFGEPYLAVESGLKCSSCHVNPSGGGKRNPFGTLYARNEIASRTVELDTERTPPATDGGSAANAGPDWRPWTGEVAKWFAVGADLRGGYESVDVPGVEEQSDFDVSRATVYALVRAVPDLLAFYFDQKVAPDNSDTREAYLLLTPLQGKLTVKAGQMFLPFGLRLEDDDAFVRQSSGVNFNSPDDGVELGLELAKWSAQVAVTEGGEGSGGSSDRISLSAAYVQPRWRVGASYNTNDDPLGDREMQGVFAGLKTGPISWLAELDFIEDETPSGGLDSYASLLEGNWGLREGHNLKVTYEYLEPDGDRGEDEQERYSLVWEYSPIQFVQSRIGVRRYNGIPNFPVSNRDELFAELHAYF